MPRGNNSFAGNRFEQNKAKSPPKAIRRPHETVLTAQKRLAEILSAESETNSLPSERPTATESECAPTERSLAI